MIHNDTIKTLRLMLDANDVIEIIHMATKQDRLENKWRRKYQDFIDQLNEKMLEWMVKGCSFAYLEDQFATIDFTPLLVEHSFDVMEEALKSSRRLPEPRSVKASKPREVSTPRSFRELMELWDLYRKKKKIPPRQKAIANKVKKEYLKRVQSVWEKHSEGLRTGKIETLEKVKEAIQKQSKATYARAQTIANTETTYYYNKTRQEIYDAAPDVTHYLFMTVRDQATTKWCKSRRGLVFKKGSQLLKENRPPVHWNCRSEILPLTPLNPKHRAIIDDKSKWAENNHMEPLPSEWKGRS